MKQSSVVWPVRVGAMLLLCVATARATSNLNLSKSNVNRLIGRGSIVTASTTVNGRVSQIVYNTPADRDFILTQACVGTASGGILLEISGIGIAQIASGQCQTFAPGAILAPGGFLTCTSSNPDASTFCTITGLLGPEPAPAAPQLR